MMPLPSQHLHIHCLPRNHGSFYLNEDNWINWIQSSWRLPLS